MKSKHFIAFMQGSTGKIGDESILFFPILLPLTQCSYAVLLLVLSKKHKQMQFLHPPPPSNPSSVQPPAQISSYILLGYKPLFTTCCPLDEVVTPQHDVKMLSCAGPNLFKPYLSTWKINEEDKFCSLQYCFLIYQPFPCLSITSSVKFF